MILLQCDLEHVVGISPGPIAPVVVLVAKEGRSEYHHGEEDSTKEAGSTEPTTACKFIKGRSTSDKNLRKN